MAKQADVKSVMGLSDLLVLNSRSYYLFVSFGLGLGLLFVWGLLMWFWVLPVLSFL